MQRQPTDTISPIRLVMAGANPLAWQDAIVLDADDAVVTLGLLDGAVIEVRSDALVDLVPGEPVAYHPIAEILATGAGWVTARR